MHFFSFQIWKLVLFFGKFWTEGVQKFTFRFWDDVKSLKYFKSTRLIPLKAAYWKWTHFAVTLTESQFTKYKGNIFFQGHSVLHGGQISTMASCDKKKWLFLMLSDWKLGDFRGGKKRRNDLIRRLQRCSVAELRILPVITCWSCVQHHIIVKTWHQRNTHSSPDLNRTCDCKLLLEGQKPCSRLRAKVAGHLLRSLR